MFDPVFTLYVSLLFTSGMAAFAARDMHHHTLARCYAANALIYASLGLCHWMRF